MTMIHNKGLFAGLIIGALVSLLGFAFYYTAEANPLRFPPAVKSAEATTTATFLTTAGATSTLVTYDTYSNNGVSGGGSTQAMDLATLMVQLAASSTSSVLRVIPEHSMDGVDWYSDETVYNSSTGGVDASQGTYYTWTAAGTATTSKAFVVRTPMRYVRLNVKIVGAAGAVWGAIQPQKQSN